MIKSSGMFGKSSYGYGGKRCSSIVKIGYILLVLLCFHSLASNASHSHPHPHSQSQSQSHPDYRAVHTRQSVFPKAKDGSYRNKGVLMMLLPKRPCPTYNGCQRSVQ
ncbi:unnamed protein product [Amaranthus hypochondriacus]